MRFPVAPAAARFPGALRALACLVLLAAGTLRPCRAADKPVFCVAGIQNRVRGRAWKELGVGFGIGNLVTQHLHDSGLFTALEDRSEIRDAVQKYRAFFWQHAGENPPPEIESIGRTLPADVVITGEVLRCRTRKRKTSVGIFSRYRRTVEVRLRLDLVDRRSGLRISAKGRGEAEKGATAVVFEARDGQIDFNGSMTGIATEQAVADAAAKLLERYRDERTDA
jgi:curli biogenesis system outer membrane secretion channel CsgG